MDEIGRLDRRVELQSPTLPAGGDPTAISWTTQATVWAERLDAKGIRRFVGLQHVAEASQAFRIRFRSDVDPTWRVKDGAELWSIEGTLPVGRKDALVLTVTRLDPDDEA